MKRLCITMMIMVIAGLTAVKAQIRGNHIQVMVVPDHQDWRYEVGQTAVFKVSVVKSSTPMDNVTIDNGIYDLYGRRVSGQPRKGIYIKNKKKFFIVIN